MHNHDANFIDQPLDQIASAYITGALINFSSITFEGRSDHTPDFDLIHEIIDVFRFGGLGTEPAKR